MGGKDKNEPDQEVADKVAKGMERLKEDLAKDESEIDDNQTSNDDG